MSLECPKLKPAVTALAAMVMFSLPLANILAAQEADLHDEAALLGALAQAEGEESDRIARQLRALWSKSGSPAMDLLLKRGRDALEASDTRAAIEHLTALTDHAPDFAEGWHARALAYFEADLFGPALADLQRALHLNPNNYNAIIGLGAILEAFGDPVGAYAAYQRAQTIHPHHEEISKAIERLKADVEGKAL